MAPIELKEYTWNQSQDAVSIFVPLPPCCSRQPSVMSLVYLQNYVKVTAPPYLVELFLAEEIDENNSKCMITPGRIIFELSKAFTKHWESIERNLSGKEKVGLRLKMVEKLQERNQKVKKEKGARKSEQKETAIKNQIQLDSERNSSVEVLKKAEREKFSKAMSDLEVAREVKEVGQEGLKIRDSLSFPIPLVRHSEKIMVNFSAREFPTPSRESAIEDERAFLSKQLSARRAAGFVSEDLRPEECNPVWLKSKGDSFYKCKNYLGAVSAYSHALKIGASMPELYSNRSACHLQLGNLHKALEDVSKAIELLTPPVPTNREMRANCYARRGIILCQLGLAEKATPEFEEAIKLRPDDLNLRSDFHACRALIEDDGRKCDE